MWLVFLAMLYWSGDPDDTPQYQEHLQPSLEACMQKADEMLQEAPDNGHAVYVAGCKLVHGDPA